jgi:hypothetical protein
MAQASFQTNDGFVVEAAPVPLGGGGEPGVERVGQVLERDGFGHGST